MPWFVQFLVNATAEEVQERYGAKDKDNDKDELIKIRMASRVKKCSKLLHLRNQTQGNFREILISKM